MDPAPAKRRKVGELPSQSTQNSAHSSKFKPGNIISLRVWNFTTYTYGEFHLSPSLNMIIGPNGTGKSTFVAAVCLALGGSVGLIKRKNLDSMIKSGHEESTLEITLRNKDDLPDLVIRCYFKRRQIRAKFTVDGQPAEASNVRQLVLGLNIQLDNLCHFLPQERVAEFASLSPENLLLEMERTVGDGSLVRDHQLLIDLDEQWVDLTAKVASLEETVASLKADVDKFEQEAQKYQEYEEKSQHIVHHKKLLPYAKLQDLKEQMKHLKVIRDQAKQALQDFAAQSKPLERRAAEAETEIELARAQHTEILHSMRSLRSSSDEDAARVESLAAEFTPLQNEIDSLKTRTEKQKKELQHVIEEREELSRKLAKMDPVDESQLEVLTQKRREKHEEKTRVDEEIDNAKFEFNGTRRNLETYESRYREERRRLDDNDRLEILKTTSTRYRRELLENAYRAHVLLRKEKREKNLRFYEAPVVSCRVTSQAYAKYFEKVVDNNTLFALFFNDESSYRDVSAVLPPGVNVPMRVVSKNIQPQPMPSARLRELGFDGYLSEFITGPEAVLQGLNHRSFLHCIPVSTKPVSPEVIGKLLEPTKDGKIPFLRFVVENNLFIVGRSRYGSKQTFYSTENIPPAQLMGAEGLTEEAKRGIQQSLADLKSKITELYDTRKELESRKSVQEEKLRDIQQELTDLETQVRDLRRKKEAHTKLKDTISHTDTRIEQLTRSTTQDHSENIRRTEASLLEKYVEYSKLMQHMAQTNEELVVRTIESKKAELLQQQSENKLITVQSLMKELESRRDDLQQRYIDARKKYEEYKRGDAAKEIQQQQMTPEEREIVRQLAEKYLPEGHLSESYILNKIQQLEDDISVLANVDRGSLELLKSKKADLELSERQLPSLTRNKQDLQDRMQKISVPWSNQLSEMCEKISKTFQKKFVAVASDGQVELVKSERYKEWKLEILVKFRENSELKVLDHQSQSGGERAVSTIFFIMSLQGLTNAPIRIVDEINQGMDPKNEKMAHKHLVHTACRKKSSQYFLVTPKLLTGLYYHPDMAIHCIFTGPYLKENKQDSAETQFLDFQHRAIGV